MNASEIEQALSGSFGRPLRFLDSVGSTNTEALAWAQNGAPEGAVVATDHQTEGRGRWGRGWSSAPGKLLQFSLVLRPHLPLDQLGLVTTALGVSCAAAIEEMCGLEPTIKWPNDVRVGGKKVAGILVETHLSGSSLEAAIAGMGVNVGWSTAEIPDEISGDATSLTAELYDSAPVPDRAALLAAILAQFERIYLSLPDGAPELVAEASRRSDVIGRDVVVALSSDEVIEGRALRLLPDGRLELQTKTGTRSLAVGEIRRLR